MTASCRDFVCEGRLLAESHLQTQTGLFPAFLSPRVAGRIIGFFGRACRSYLIHVTGKADITVTPNARPFPWWRDRAGLIQCRAKVDVKHVDQTHGNVAVGVRSVDRVGPPG